MSKEDHVTSSLVLALIELGQEDCQLNKSFNYLQVYYDILGKSQFKGYDSKIIESDPVAVQAINHHIALNQDPAYMDTINEIIKRSIEASDSEDRVTDLKFAVHLLIKYK